jgi:hypothetical protein
VRRTTTAGIGKTATDRNRPALTGNPVATGLVVAGTVSLLALGTAFGLLALGIGGFRAAFPVGFGGVLPTALGFAAFGTTRAE